MEFASEAWMRWNSRPWAAERRFALRLAFGLVLVLWPWAGGHRVAALASEVVNAGASLVFSGPESLQMHPEGPPDSWNALLTIRNGLGTERVLWELRRIPYIPTAVFAALTLAFPLGSRKRRFVVLAMGVMILQALPLLRLILLLSSNAPIRLVGLPSWLHSALVVACGALVFPPGMAYAVPLLLWLLSLSLLDRAALALAVRSALGLHEPGHFAPPVSRLSPKSRQKHRRNSPHGKRGRRRRSRHKR